VPGTLVIVPLGLADIAPSDVQRARELGVRAYGTEVLKELAGPDGGTTATRVIGGSGLKQQPRWRRAFEGDAPAAHRRARPVHVVFVCTQQAAAAHRGDTARLGEAIVQALGRVASPPAWYSTAEHIDLTCSAVSVGELMGELQTRLARLLSADWFGVVLCHGGATPQLALATMLVAGGLGGASGHNPAVLGLGERAGGGTAIVDQLALTALTGVIVGRPATVQLLGSMVAERQIDDVRVVMETLPSVPVAAKREIRRAARLHRREVAAGERVGSTRLDPEHVAVALLAHEGLAALDRADSEAAVTALGLLAEARWAGHSPDATAVLKFIVRETAIPRWRNELQHDEVFYVRADEVRVQAGTGVTWAERLAPLTGLLGEDSVAEGARRALAHLAATKEPAPTAPSRPEVIIAVGWNLPTVVSAMSAEIAAVVADEVVVRLLLTEHGGAVREASPTAMEAARFHQLVQAALEACGVRVVERHDHVLPIPLNDPAVPDWIAEQVRMMGPGRAVMVDAVGPKALRTTMTLQLLAAGVRVTLVENLESGTAGQRTFDLEEAVKELGERLEREALRTAALRLRRPKLLASRNLPLAAAADCLVAGNVWASKVSGVVEDPGTPPVIRDAITKVRQCFDVGRASLLVTQADARLAGGSFDGLRAAVLAVPRARSHLDRDGLVTRLLDLKCSADLDGVFAAVGAPLHAKADWCRGRQRDCGRHHPVDGDLKQRGTIDAVMRCLGMRDICEGCPLARSPEKQALRGLSGHHERAAKTLREQRNRLSHDLVLAAQEAPKMVAEEMFATYGKPWPLGPDVVGSLLHHID